MDLKQVKIVKKESVGVKPVYDLCVPDQHHYILDSGVVSHNSGFIYASSIVVAMGKFKLKTNEDGVKTSTVRGIRSSCKIMKTRYSKPFENIELEIPYSTGMDPYSGLFTFFEGKGALKREGNSYTYTAKDGTVIKKFQKAWKKNEDGCLDLLMKEWAEPVQASAADDSETESEGV